MAFPTNPVDGFRYKNYKYSALSGAWNKTPKGSILNTYNEIDSTGRVFTNITPTMAVGMVWPEMDCDGLSKLDISLKILGRNDADAWGGLFTILEYRIDEGSGYGSYISLGNSGHDVCMSNGSSLIGSAVYPFLVDCSTITNSFKIQFRCQHCAFNGSTTVNTGNSATGDFFSSLKINEIAV